MKCLYFITALFAVKFKQIMPETLFTATMLVCDTCEMGHKNFEGLHVLVK